MCVCVRVCACVCARVCARVCSTQVHTKEYVFEQGSQLRVNGHFRGAHIKGTPGRNGPSKPLTVTRGASHVNTRLCFYIHLVRTDVQQTRTDSLTKHSQERGLALAQTHMKFIPRERHANQPNVSDAQTARREFQPALGTRERERAREANIP